MQMCMCSTATSQSKPLHRNKASTEQPTNGYARPNCFDTGSKRKNGHKQTEKSMRHKCWHNVFVVEGLVPGIRMLHARQPRVHIWQFCIQVWTVFNFNNVVQWHICQKTPTFLLTEHARACYLLLKDMLPETCSTKGDNTERNSQRTSKCIRSIRKE